MIKYRLSLFISNRHIYIQIIDIIQNITIISTSTYKKKWNKKNKTEKAKQILQKIINKLEKKKIFNLLFNNKIYKYKGIIKIILNKLKKNNIIINKYEKY